MIPWIGGVLMWIGECLTAILFLGVIYWGWAKARDWEIRNSWRP